MTLYNITLLDWAHGERAVAGEGTDGAMVAARLLLRIHKFGSLIQLIIWKLIGKWFWFFWFGPAGRCGRRDQRGHWNAFIYSTDKIGNFRFGRPKSVCLFVIMGIFNIYYCYYFWCSFLAIVHFAKRLLFRPVYIFTFSVFLFCLFFSQINDHFRAHFEINCVFIIVIRYLFI